MTEQKATPIPQEWKLTPEEQTQIADKVFVKYKTCYKTWDKVNSTNVNYLIKDIQQKVADAAVAKCAPLAAQKAREEIYKRGEEDCPHHLAKIREASSFTVPGDFRVYKKRECSQCWQNFKE